MTHTHQTFINPPLPCVSCKEELLGPHEGFSISYQWLSTDPWSMLALVEWYDLVAHDSGGTIITFNDLPDKQYLCWGCLVKRVEKIKEILE